MPFKSQKQAAYLKHNEPEVFDKWRAEYHKGKKKVRKDAPPILLFMSNLHEIAKSNPDSSDVHVQGTLRVLRPRRHGRAKDKKVTTWS